LIVLKASPVGGLQKEFEYNFMKLSEQKLYIGNRYVDATSGKTFDTSNPATGETICQVQMACLCIRESDLRTGTQPLNTTPALKASTLNWVM
jgi:hypothetical protein